MSLRRYLRTSGKPILKMSRSLGMVFSFATVLVSCMTGCALYPTSPAAPSANGPGVLLRYASFHDQVAGIAVSQGGRIFVSFPCWDKHPRLSVAEVQADGSLRPYPDDDWNAWGEGGERKPDAHFISAQSLFVDANNVLWVLDAPAPFSRAVTSTQGAKLVAIDLASDRVKKVVALGKAVAPPGSYLRNVCVDQWGSHAYVSDAGTGALVVTDLDTGVSRRVLAGNPSTMAERGVVLTIGGKPREGRGEPVQFQVTGIALDGDSANLYYHALTAHTLYRIQTRYLNDPSVPAEELGRHVERMADTGPVDGMAMGSNHNLYLTAPEEHAVKRYRVSDHSLVTVAQDDEAGWLDSICTAPGGLLYVTASQFDRLLYFNNGQDKRIPPYTLYRILMLGLYE